ncbi:unnamed protein product [Prunus armeniaca]
MASMASLDIFSEGEQFDPKRLQEKMRINRHAFSGGQDSIEKHKEFRANLELTGVDMLNTIGYIYARKSAKELQCYIARTETFIKLELHPNYSAKIIPYK